MDSEETLLVSELISAYKHLWVEHQTFKYLNNHPNADPEEVHGEFVETAYDLFLPLNEALLERQPLLSCYESLYEKFSILNSKDFGSFHTSIKMPKCPLVKTV